MSDKTQQDDNKGDRIAKVIARAGVASRRAAETIIAEGRVSVNGKVINSPALNVTDKDRIVVDGKLLAAPEPARLWLYHKPTGLVTTNSDEKGRATIYDELPATLPRVMSVGRLDLNSEGLLLLTNDGGLKRQLELPSTGWLRKYRVRVKGTVDTVMLDPLREGITVEGEKFQPMQVQFDRQQGANAWLTIGLREGKNREIRRAMEAIGLTVNRLLRVSYGPFKLNQLKTGEVEEVKRRVLREQMGWEAEEETPNKPRRKGPRVARKPSKIGGPGQPGRPKTDDTPTRGRGGKPGPRGATELSPRTERGGKPSGKPSGKPTGKSGAKPGGRPNGRPAKGPNSAKPRPKPTRR